MLFKNIPGQDKTKNYLMDLIQSDSIPHALLFTGPQGNGKLAMAMAFAARLQCKESSDLQVCGVCSDCQKSLKNIHPDIHISFPVIKLENKKREDTTSIDFLPQFRKFLDSKPFGGYQSWLEHIHAENKLANINRTECQQIIRSLSLQKYEGPYKIQIIWMAEKLGKEGNRLLKLIEEPTPDTIIILLADSSNSLLNTIVSRCQIVNIPPFQDEDVSILLDGLNLAEDRKKEIVRLAFGNMNKAIGMATEEDNDWDEYLLQIMRTSYSLNAEKIKAEVSHLTSLGKHNIISFCHYGLYFFREYLKALHVNNTDICRLSMKEKNTVLRMMKVVDETMVSELVNLFETNIGLIQRNINNNILWVNTLFTIGQMMRRKKIAA